MDVLMVLVFHHTERHPQGSAWAKFLSIIHMSCCELSWYVKCHPNTNDHRLNHRLTFAAAIPHWRNSA